MRDKIFAGLAFSIIIFFLSSGALKAEWPERGITLVSSIPEVLPWSGEPTPQAEILAALVPRLSRELGVPVNLLVKSEGQGVLAANMVAGASPDAYILGALGPDQALGRVIQGYTPYVWNELSPVATGWREVNAIVVKKDSPVQTLADLASVSSITPHRLAHQGQGALDVRTIMAISAAKAAGFSWILTPVKQLDPALLLQNQAEAMVLPLGWLNRHPRLDQFRVLTLLVQDSQVPCAKDLPTLANLGSQTMESSLFAFYIPAQVNWRIKSRLSSAINNALRQPALSAALKEACLIPYREDLEGTEAVMNLEYNKLASEIVGLIPAAPEPR